MSSRVLKLGKRPRAVASAVLVFLFSSWAASGAAAQDRLCDPGGEDCRQILIDHIRAETVGLDVGFWFMEDSWIASEIINRWKAGVPVRVLMDTRANAPNPLNAQRLAELQAAGIPMRERFASGILHWKAMIFAGQGLVEFSGANYSSDAWTPATSTPYENYVDEAIYFTRKPSVVQTFMTKYDDLWTNTTAYRDYANITGPLTRAYPTYPFDPEINFPPEESYAVRAVNEYYKETQKMDVIMYRITDRRHTDALIDLHGRGLPIRLITDPQQYRDPKRLWHSWNVDRLYMAGIPIKQRAHAGLNHQKSVLLYGQGMTIFGSSNWTSPSAHSQEEHNYFTKDAWVFQWFVDQFERKWNNSAGIIENEPFTPLPPTAPDLPEPAYQATGVPTTNVVLKWDGSPWAHNYDVYFGTAPGSMELIGENLPLGPSQYYGHLRTFAVPFNLQPGTQYYWRVVGKTMANLTATSGLWTFTTDGGAPPPPSLPAPWNSRDVGTVGLPGNASFSDGLFTLEGSGADVWGTADELHWVWREVSGDVDIVARVASVENVHAWTKAGVMIRETHLAGSPQAFMLVSPGKGLAFQRRVATSGISTHTSGGAGTAPAWVKLERRGNVITAFRSTDGASWTLVGQDTFAMGATVNVGIAVSSHDNAQLATATFDNVSVTLPGAPANTPPAVSLTTPANGATFMAPASIGVAANATDADGSVAQVQFFAGTTLIGTDTSSPYAAIWSNVPAGSYTLTAVATDNSGASTTSAPVTVTVTAASGLPAPWVSQDIGAVGVAGSAGESGGTFTVRGSGADVWGSADGLHYVWQQMSGDVDVIARVASVEYVHAWTKAGVMIRESLGAGSAQAFMLVSPGKGLAFQRRLTEGGLSTNTSGGTGSAPAWVKLERRGNTITAFRSDDGATWTLVGSDTFAMGATVYVGLGLTSHDNARLATATFDNVSVTAPGGGGGEEPPPASSWESQDLGAVGLAGSAAETDGAFTVRGSGDDVWGTADAFHYMWRQMSGDVEVVARVASVEWVDQWTKAGVMIRESLTADSPHGFMLVSPGKGLAFQRRVAAGGLSTHTSGGTGTAPAWVKLERRGETITAYRSNDGASWTVVGSDAFSMAAQVYVGLAVSSHDNARLAAATFDSVSITPLS